MFTFHSIYGKPDKILVTEYGAYRYTQRIALLEKGRTASAGHGGVMNLMEREGRKMIADNESSFGK